jgi:FAD/FMN-containing dehydrogenase
MITQLLSDQLGRKIHWNNLSHIPGSLIDDIYTEPVTSTPQRMLRNGKTKLIFFTLFPILAFINIISNFLTVLFFMGRIVMSHSADKRQTYKDKATYAFDAAIKNIFGFTFCFIAAYYTREFSFLMIAEPQKNNQILSGGSYATKPTNIKPPRNIAEVVKFVKAIAYLHNTGDKRSVTIKGAGRSQGTQFIPADKNSIVLDLKHLNHVVVSDDRKTITVGAGATWQQIEDRISKLGLALKVRQASNVFSVGGSASANVHGWSHKEGSIVNTIESIKIVNSKGELQELTPADELFGYVIGGYGMFGVIVEVKLQVTPNIMLQETGKVVAIDEYVNYYHGDSDAINPNDQTTKMHLYRLSLDPKNLLKTGIAVNYVATESEPKPRPVTVSKEGRYGRRFDRILTNIARRLPIARRWYWESEVKRILDTKAPPATLVEHMQAPIRAMFNPARSEAEWLQEYFVPGPSLAEFLSDLGDLLMANEVSLLNASVRPVRRDNITQLGYANSSDMYAVVLCFNQKLDDDSKLVTRRWVKKANDLVLRNGGTYYLPYQPFATIEQFRNSYPNWQKVVAKKREVDPTEIFASEFFAKYFKDQNFNPYRVFTHEGLMNKFAGFLSNVLVEIEPKDLNNLMVNILGYAETNEEIFTELHRRIGEAKPSFIESIRRELLSLAMIKKDLSQQAFELMYPNGYQPNNPISGILEIGYPGRFLKTMINQLSISGKVEVMQEASAITDVIQSGYPMPHSRTHHLSYSEPDFSSIDSEKFDLVTCFVGLHHFTTCGLEDFLFGINRVLRKDGSFLLVDHDVTDGESLAMATLAHSIFNAAKGASIAEEFDEVRNFQSLDTWKNVLDKYGFECMTSPRTMIRDGDPSLNTMVRFKKVRDISHDSFNDLLSAAIVEPVIDRIGSKSPSVVFRTIPDYILTQKNVGHERRQESYLKETPHRLELKQ